MSRYTSIECGELADLAEKLPEGDLRTWCNLSASGPRSMVVLADSEMLSRCQQAVSSPSNVESKKESKKCKVLKTLKEKPGTSL